MVTALGHRPVWGSLPPPFFEYFYEVVRRIRALGLPPPKTHWFQRRQRAKRNDDPAEPGLAIKYMGLPKVEVAQGWIASKVGLERSPHKSDGAPSPPAKRRSAGPRASPSLLAGRLAWRSPPRPADACVCTQRDAASPPARRSLALVDVECARAAAFGGGALQGSPLLAAVKGEASRIYLAPSEPRRALPSAAPHERALPTRPLQARLDHLMKVTA